MDWSERHHDVAVVDQDGILVAKRRISDDATRFAEFLTRHCQVKQSSADFDRSAIGNRQFTCD
ncbi:hypothetical protein R3Q06_34725 [Rhodococcus erythropolis]|uniref:IS110 family transposase n=1 Tax=Rhodococcus erythropolis TaxID=1833 RepID=UPI00294A36F1|nr:hypothetical protein [Rhodococcus erythropolis]MDV6278554.1 hypothetical protein [Rhodococcus erythropolis]